MENFFVGTVRVQTIATVEQGRRRSHCEDDFKQIQAPYNDVPKHVCFEECNKENDVFVCLRLIQCIQSSAGMCTMS